MEDTTQPNQVIVTVDNSGNVACNPSPLPADGRNIELKFVLKSDGYVFPQVDAVAVRVPSPEFPRPSRTLPPNNRKATLFDCNSKAGVFTYTVTVQRIATGELFTHDPIINNGP
jgi:hypothetical protein